MRTILLWCLLALPALARVGGGESYSGGGGSYSGGGGGGGGDGIGILIELVIRLVFYYPKIGIPLVVGVGIYLYVQYSKSQAGRAFRDLQRWSAENTTHKKPRTDLREFTRSDPNFSETLFLDFITSLYSRALLGSGRSLAAVGGYLASGVRQRLEAERVGVEAVVIGSLRIQGVYAGGEQERVEVLLESNVTQTDGRDLYVVDEMVLVRKTGASTPEPETVHALSCPNCGNNTAITEEGRCPSCDQIVNDGRKSWLLRGLARISATAKSPVVLSQAGEEIGTDLPTVRSRTLTADLAALRQRDPDFDENRFKSFAAQTFLTLQEAWTALRWEKVRPLETDYLFHQHQYWIEGYRKQGVRNVLEEVEVQDVVTARVSLDRYFDAITVRIFSSMKDYTVDASTGKVLVGFPDKTRRFSEYWTFVRRAGVTSKDRDATRCPNCGAPLDKVNHAGDCEYCQTRITRGDFDWVLSRIEQDEAYG